MERWERAQDERADIDAAVARLFDTLCPSDRGAEELILTFDQPVWAANSRRGARAMVAAYLAKTGPLLSLAAMV